MQSASLAMSKSKSDHIDLTVRKERGRLLGFIRRFVKDREEAEDILQDVFYQFVVAYDTIRSIGAVSSWLFRVARNRITDFNRKKRPGNFSDFTYSGQEESENVLMLEDLLPGSDHLPDQLLFREMIWSRIEQTLAQMPENQRQVFVWHEFEQKSFKEMEVLTGETVNTLLSRKRYAVLALREALVDLYEELIID